MVFFVKNSIPSSSTLHSSTLTSSSLPDNLRAAFQGLDRTNVFMLSPLTELNAPHRRRIDLEDIAKVVTSDWGTESLPRLLFGLFETNG